MVQTIEKSQESSKTVFLDEEVLKVFASMPDALKLEVLHYAEYLISKHLQNPEISSQLEKPKKKRQAGSLKGKIWMSDDFDDPIENFEEYEEKYGYGSLAGKITMSDDFDEPLEDLKEYM